MEQEEGRGGEGNHTEKKDVEVKGQMKGNTHKRKIYKR